MLAAETIGARVSSAAAGWTVGFVFVVGADIDVGPSGSGTASISFGPFVLSWVDSAAGGIREARGSGRASAGVKIAGSGSGSTGAALSIAVGTSGLAIVRGAAVAADLALQLAG
jgi:hypothetical protein